MPRQLNRTFKDILHKSGTLSSSKTPKWTTDGAPTLQRLSNVSLTLFSVLGVFEVRKQSIRSRQEIAYYVTKRALSTINPTMDGRHGDHYRVALLELSTPTGLTIQTYRTKLNQYFAQTQAQLNSLGQFEGLRSPSTGMISLIVPHKGGTQEVVTIEEISETEVDGSTANGYTLNGDSGKNSLPRRILRRLIPSSVGRKDV